MGEKNAETACMVTCLVRGSISIRRRLCTAFIHQLTMVTKINIDAIPSADLVNSPRAMTRNASNARAPMSTYRRMYETWLRALIGIFELAFCWEGAVQRSHQELLAAHEINKVPPKNLVRAKLPPDMARNFLAAKL